MSQLFKLGDHWVLFVSPYGKVQYYVGDFDADTCRFQAQTHGFLDCGPNFTAPNTMQLPDGRRIVWGWLNGFPGGHGWNGCLSLPRVLSLTEDGQLRQSPAPQLRALRGDAIAWRHPVLLSEGPHSSCRTPTRWKFWPRCFCELPTALSFRSRMRRVTLCRLS